MTDPRVELASLVAAFRARLDWEQGHGSRHVRAAPSPRLGLPPEPEPDPIVAATAVAPAPAAPAPTAPSPHVEPGPPPPPPSRAPAAPAGPLEPAPSVAAAGDRRARLEHLRAELGECHRCRLGDTRRNLVFGVGDPEAQLMVVGEGPGRDEDLQGEPFVGAAGQLLTKMLEAMGLGRDDVYIANIIKCRPPQNRDPAPDEIAACERFLQQQVEIISPRIILAMGNFAAKTLLRTEVGITRLRGRFHAYQGIPLMPTFHPAYLLRNADGKRPAWEDLKQVMAEMDRLGLRRRRS